MPNAVCFLEKLTKWSGKKSSGFDWRFHGRVGDAEKQADDSAVKDFLQRQLSEALTGLGAELFDRLILAYEPIWAIGARSGAAASPDRIARSIRSIRDGLSSSFRGVGANPLRRERELPELR
jgi:hypothetical protein